MDTGWLRAPSDRAVTVGSLILILIGCVLRLIWAFNGHMAPINSEAFFIARALAEGRGFSEAFGAGTGPTAHLMPLTPLPAALVYSLLGVGTPAAELVLMIWSLFFVGGSFLLAERILRELGSPPWARLAAVAAVAVLPIQFSLEMVNFRVWEAGVATFAVLAIVLATLRLDRRSAIGLKTLVGLGLANAATFLINPAAALGSSGAIGLLLLRRVPVWRWPVPVVTALVVVLAVLIPWGLRNEQMLGKFVPLRTGAGMSLAMAYYDGRLREGDIQAEEFERFKALSPLMGEAARARYLAVGEVAYNRELGAEARAWAKAHPAEVLKIRVRNFVEFYAPPSWQWTRFTRGGVRQVTLRSTLVTLFTGMAVLTLGAALFARRYRWLYIAAALLGPCLPYIMTYPLLRYRYIVSTLLIFVAVHGAFLLLARLRRRAPAAA